MLCYTGGSLIRLLFTISLDNIIFSSVFSLGLFYTVMCCSGCSLGETGCTIQPECVVVGYTI